MRTSAASEQLRRAARRCGIGTTFTDSDGETHTIGDETLAALVTLLDRDATITGLPPVVVAWNGVMPEAFSGRYRVELDRFETDRFGPPEPGGEGRGTDGPIGRDDGRGDSERLPYGVHGLVVDDDHVVPVIAAPAHIGTVQSERADSKRAHRPWGVFAPVYALRDGRERPAGDITALEGLGLLASSFGASAVAVLPLLAELATADGGAPGQRPYSPLSRLFWNEGYLDLTRIPELREDGSPTPLLDGNTNSAAPVRAHSDHPGSADVAALAAGARPALDEALRRLYRVGGARLESFEAYVADRPELERYARYRAAVEIAGCDRTHWPSSWRAGDIGASEVPSSIEQRHRFAQWAMDEQLAATATALAAAGTGIVMDLPIGCSATGFDPWAFPDVYVNGAAIGAPPDTFFGGGQNWGFPPPHPDVDRHNGYPVLRACLAQSMRHASVLRVDHILGWSRLWWIPAGMPAVKGAYVRYPMEELLAIASLEARRHSARLVGEDLGTVERGLRAKLARYGVAGMSVAVFDMSQAPRRQLRPRAGSAAYVDTHDTATFAGWLDGSDVELRARLGLLEPEDAAAELDRRVSARRALVDRLARSGALRAGDTPETIDALDVLGAVLAELGESEAELVLVAVEDLWGERDPQNVPGTVEEHANFSRRLAYRIEELGENERARSLLGQLDAARRADHRRPR